MTYAIGIALLGSLWQGILVAAALWAALSLLPARRPEIRYSAAVTALVLSIGWFAATAVSAYFEPATIPAVAAKPNPNMLWLSRFAWVWIAGVAAVGAQRLLAWALLEHKVRRRTDVPMEAWIAALDTVRQSMRVARRIAIRRADWLTSPSVYGWLKPMILIPAGVVAGLTPQQLEAILAHELAHIVRYDYLVNLLQTAAETLLFYHPAVWWISRQIRQERECCCDEIAVGATGDRGVFAGALLQLEEQRAATLVLAASHGSLKLRIERLFAVSRQPRHPWIVPLLILACIAAPYVYAQAQDIPKPYLLWLNEDVTYIITDDERKAFERLSSNEERDHFIAQFWARRNPDPQAQENRYKEEHYRRIAWANGRFGAEAAPGWKSDRGRTYIRFGPPDELEEHPKEKKQAWLYRNKPEGAVIIFRFVDGVLQKP